MPYKKLSEQNVHPKNYGLSKALINKGFIWHPCRETNKWYLVDESNLPGYLRNYVATIEVKADPGNMFTYAIWFELTIGNRFYKGLIRTFPCQTIEEAYEKANAELV